MFLHLEWWKWIIGMAETLAVYVPMHVWSNRLVVARASERQFNIENEQAAAENTKRDLKELRKLMNDMNRQHDNVTYKIKALQASEQRIIDRKAKWWLYDESGPWPSYGEARKRPLHGPLYAVDEYWDS